MAESSLPDAFFDLNPYLEWALPSEHARRAKRASTSMSEIRAFYDAMLERMEAVLSFLEKYPADDPPAGRRTVVFCSRPLWPRLRLRSRCTVSKLQTAWTCCVSSPWIFTHSG